MAKQKTESALAVGELIRFYSSFESFQREYDKRNPGVVLKIKRHKSSQDYSKRLSAEVLWSDGSITSEHATYLQRVNT